MCNVTDIVHKFLSLSGRYLAAESLGHLATPRLAFWGTGRLLFEVAVPFCRVTRNGEVLQFLISPHYYLFSYSHSSRYWCRLIYVLLRFTCWNHNSQCDGCRAFGKWLGSMRSEEQSSHDGISLLLRRELRVYTLSLGLVEDTLRRWLSVK